MLRAFHKILASKPDSHLRRRRHRFAPSITAASSCLEDRVVLSGGAGHAAAARPLADTAAGQKVTNLFESITHNAPTSQQLTQWVNKLRHGVSPTVLRKDLVKAARAAGNPPNSSVGPIVANSPGGAASSPGVILPIIGIGPVAPTSTGTTPPNSSVGPIVANAALATTSGSTGTNGATGVTGTIGVGSGLPAGLTSPFVNSSPVASAGLNVNQSPFGVSIGGVGSTGTTGSARTGTVTGITASGTTLATTTTGTISTGLSTGTTAGTTTATANDAALLAALEAEGFLPTTPANASSTAAPISTIGPVPGALTFSPLAFGPLTFIPTLFPTGPANPSPLPTNGTLPFTGTPANPSPLPANGTLPFTGTPANPSPLPLNGTVPFTGTPANPSPVPTTGGLF